MATATKIDATDFDKMEQLLAANRAELAKAGIEPFKAMVTGDDWTKVRDGVAAALKAFGGDPNIQVQLQGMLNMMDRVEKLPALIERKLSA